MRRTPILIWAVTLVASWAYLVWCWPRIPEVVPMQWDFHNRPTWTAPKEAFAAFFVIIPLLVSGVALAVSFREPGVAWVAAGVGANALFLAHVCVQAFVTDPFLPVPVNVGVLVVLASAFIGLPILAWRHRRSPRPG